MRLLFAEDDRDLSAAVKTLLERNGYTVDAVYERIAMQEQQPTTLLGVAVVFQVDLQRAQQIGLVLAVIALDDVERRVQQTVDFAVLADGIDQRIQCSVNRTASSTRFGVFSRNLDVFDLHFPSRFPCLWLITAN